MGANKITVLRGGQVVSEHELRTPLVIGRTPQSDLQLEDPQMSRVHATITSEGGRYFVTDSSTNGVVLDGQRIAKQVPVELRDGSSALLTSFELRFHIDRAEPVPATQALAGKAKEKPAAAAAPAHVGGGPPVWNGGELAVRVADIVEESPDAKTFRLVGVEPTLFDYKPGQFIQLTVEIDGKEVKRSYSISSSPSRPHALELTIKRVPDGLVSNWMNDAVKLGDRLRIKGPSGKFTFVDNRAPKVLLLAAGSGVTPIMSMSRWIVDTAEEVDVVLLYSARSPSDLIFRRELELLASRHGAFRVYMTITQGCRNTETWTGLTGRNSCDMLRLVCPDLLERKVFMCGPKPFADSVKEQLAELGFALDNMHTESFGGRPPKPKGDGGPPPAAVATPPAPKSAAPAPAPKPAPAKKAPKAAAPSPPGHSVTFKTSGVAVVCDGKTSLLEVAEEHDVSIDSSCRAGTCLTCKVRCLSGEIDMDDGTDLEEAERAAGWILACSSRAKSDVVIEA